MKINDYKMPDVNFVLCDEVTKKRFGGRIKYGFQNHMYPTLPDKIEFVCVEDLQDTIKLLTDIYEMAIEARSEYEQLR